ncbi:SsgA family sporulation/cell division regulator [Nonomuraea sp. NPDC050153]|uniref:SsgA family sporulation/cell division regulator n=1 Tax=Nonomuraea sp. NPDC050153 TaxID=3364359 RepID=UPI0037A187A8
MNMTLRRPLILWAVTRDGDQPHAASIIFRRDDPFAVEIVLPLHDVDAVTNDQLRVDPDSRDDAISVVITFSRALLIDGLEAPAGEGQVRVEPHIVDSDYITIRLPLTADGVAFCTERAPLEAFVDATYRMVPLGGEKRLAAKELDRWLAEVAV